MVSLKVILCERIETFIVFEAYFFCLLTQCACYTTFIKCVQGTHVKCNLSSHLSDDMFSVLGTQQQLPKFVTTVSRHGNTFMGDGITANIGAPLRNGNCLFKQ